VTLISSSRCPVVQAGGSTEQYIIVVGAVSVVLLETRWRST
jgi:hypothetical protein